MAIEASPTVANGVVYVATLYNSISYAVTANTGTLLWKYAIGEEVLPPRP